VTLVGGQTSFDVAIEQLADELDRWHTPGAEVAVVRGGEVLFAGGVGVRGVDDPTAVGPSTLFHHGSCGKAYTSLTATLLAEDGVLDLDVPVRRYVPELRLPDMTVADRMTVRDLLSHRSGLARHDLVWILNPSWDAEALVARLARLPLAGDLRGQWLYSNLGYAVAGLAMGRAAGTSWADELRGRVFEPGDMSRSWTDVRRTRDDPDHATPHIARDGKPVPTVWRLLTGAAPAGEVMTCAGDAATWLLVQTGAADFISRSAVTETHKLQAPVPSGMSPFAELHLYGYSMGWLVSTWRGRPMLSHTGGVDGFTTHTAVLPEQQIGVTVSVNQHLSSLAMAAALQIADALLGERAEPSWLDRLHPEHGDGPGDVAPPQRVPEDAADAAVAARPPVHPLSSYAGTFANPGYGEMFVSVVDGTLAVRIGELDFDASHRRLDTWDLRYDPLDVDAPLTFGTGPDGTVQDATLRLEGEPPLAYVRSAAGE